MGQRKIWPPLAKNPDPIVTKVAMRGYVGDIYPYAKFGPYWIRFFAPPIYAKLPTKVTRLLF